VLDEWLCRFDPEGPFGATHIHGIRDADVMGAPRFAHVLPEISARLARVHRVTRQFVGEPGYHLLAELVFESPEAMKQRSRARSGRPRVRTCSPGEAWSWSPCSLPSPTSRWTRQRPTDSIATRRRGPRRRAGA
jgi:hypothetical protein